VLKTGITADYFLYNCSSNLNKLFILPLALYNSIMRNGFTMEVLANLRLNKVQKYVRSMGQCGYNEKYFI
jgi:hypothetical protein